jgi:hypothetical protein
MSACPVAVCCLVGADVWPLWHACRNPMLEEVASKEEVDGAPPSGTLSPRLNVI